MTTKTLTHTQTPWNLNGIAAWSDSCKDRGNIFLCDLRTGTHIPKDQNLINAAFIIKAVNAHEGFIKLLKLAVLYLEHPDVQAMGFALNSGVVAKRIEAAIALAEAQS